MMLTGAILAGGQNRRMNGQAKALLPFQGELMIQRQMKQMELVCDEIIVVTNNPEAYGPILGHEMRIAGDFIPGKGPLSGIHAALSLSNGQDVWIVACDMPFISAAAARLMLEMKAAAGSLAAIPEVAGRMHPLHGIYDKRVAEVIPPLLDSGRQRVQDMLELIRARHAPEELFTRQGLDLRFVTNVNTPEEYAEAQNTIDIRG